VVVPAVDDEAARILNETGNRPYRHVIVDEAQDLHPAQWRLCLGLADASRAASSASR